jgi:hypothetical protein
MTATRLNGCYDRPPFATHYQVGVRPVLADGAVQEVPVLQVNRGSQDCNYTHTALGQKDPGCAGCKHKALK